MSRRPHWPISKVKDLCGHGHILVAHAISDGFPSRSEAVAVIAEIIADLSVRNFARTDELEHCLADVYGVIVDGRGWYLKLTIVEDAGAAVLVISFHALEHPLRTKGGMVEP